MTDWPPRLGQLWLTTERWPATYVEPEIPGGTWVTILGGEARFDPITRTPWWCGEVLGPYGVTFIKATEGDLLPADDPRIVQPAQLRGTLNP